MAEQQSTDLIRDTHALETGRELLATKEAIPHGVWGGNTPSCLTEVCVQQGFTRGTWGSSKANESALLMLEGTLDGKAKIDAMGVSRHGRFSPWSANG